jgi:hypothetical protein
MFLAKMILGAIMVIGAGLIVIFFDEIIGLLPLSPFLDIQYNMPEFVRNLLGYVNYYIPLNIMLGIGLAWLGCVALYYGVGLLLRLVKAIK